MGSERGHRTLTVQRKGDKIVTIPLAPRTARSLDLAIGSARRKIGPSSRSRLIDLVMPARLAMRHTVRLGDRHATYVVAAYLAGAAR